jgi:hypothetical protein
MAYRVVGVKNLFSCILLASPAICIGENSGHPPFREVVEVAVWLLLMWYTPAEVRALTEASGPTAAAVPLSPPGAGLSGFGCLPHMRHYQQRSCATTARQASTATAFAIDGHTTRYYVVGSTGCSMSDAICHKLRSCHGILERPEYQLEFCSRNIAFARMHPL